MLRRRSYLQEGLFDVWADVEWLYEKSGLERLDKVLSGDRLVDEVVDALNWAVKKKSFFRTNSSKLKTFAASQAHEVNPVSEYIPNLGGISYGMQILTT